MKINSLKFNNSTIHKMYHGDELVNKIGDAFTYMDASGDTPTPPTPVPYSGQYLTFVAERDNMSVGLTYANNNVFQYSVDSGQTWSNLANSGSTTAVNSGQTIMFKASGLTVTLGDGIGTLTPSVSASVQGNVMSLFYGDDFSEQTTITKNDQFRGLFYYCANLTSAENLILPATSLKQYCYGGMFAGCTSLTSAPTLPATTLDNYCYRTMFDGCTSLTVAPELPATTLAQGCYYYMFRGCTSLNYIKCHATNISARYCTNNWVNGVAVDGTFVKAASMNDWECGDSGIPNDWVVYDEYGNEEENPCSPDIPTDDDPNWDDAE